MVVLVILKLQIKSLQFDKHLICLPDVSERIQGQYIDC